MTIDSKKLSDDLMADWYGALAPVGSKDADTKFEATIEFCTYDQPTCMITHNGYFAGEVTVETKGDPHLALALCVFETIEATLPWCDGVLAEESEYDEDQIATAHLLRQAHQKHELTMGFVKLQLIDLVVR